MKPIKYKKCVYSVEIGSDSFFGRVKITEIRNSKDRDIKKENESKVRPIYIVHIGSKGILNRIKVTKMEDENGIKLLNKLTQKYLK